MNIQLVKMVHMMIMLNNVEAERSRKGQHIERKLSSGAKKKIVLNELFKLYGAANKIHNPTKTTRLNLLTNEYKTSNHSNLLHYFGVF